LLYIIYIGTVIFVGFGLHILFMTKRAYDKGETLSIGVSLGWWILDTAWTILIVLSSLHNLWPLPIEKMAAAVCGLVLFIIGMVLTLAGVFEFHSLRKVSGMEVSKLITTGIYHWSRNPQFLGLYFALLGISLFGRSGFAVLLAIIAIIYCHYYIVKMEKPHLERIFGTNYVMYKSRTPRYIGIPKSRKDITK